MGFNSAFKGLKLLKKKPGNGRLNNLNDSSRPQCVKCNVIIRFALPKSQPDLFNVQSRVTAFRVPCGINRTKFMLKEPKLHSGHRQTSTAGANTGV